jgi:hypothetical protein
MCTRTQVLTDVTDFLKPVFTMKMVVFWVVALRSLVEVYRRFRGAASIIRALSLDDGGSKYL